jgi:hypothetical protein
LPIVGGSRGETYTFGGKLSGASFIFLPEHTAYLKEYAWMKGVELKEAHFQDDVVETMLHESLHAAIVAGGAGRAIAEDFYRRGYPRNWAVDAEEAVVERITKETMKDIRELPPLALVKRRPR